MAVMAKARNLQNRRYNVRSFGFSLVQPRRDPFNNGPYSSGPQRRIFGKVFICSIRFIFRTDRGQNWDGYILEPTR